MSAAIAQLEAALAVELLIRHHAQGVSPTPAGRRFRRLLAGAAIVGAPMLFRLPVLKRYPLLRALELAGGAALLVKFAEALRDWEPTARRGVVLDVPGTSG